MEITHPGKLDKQIIQKAKWLVYFINNLRMFLFCIVFLTASVFFFVLTEKYSTFALVLLILAVFFTCFYLVLSGIVQHKIVKNYRIIQNNPLNEYTFLDTKLVITFRGKVIDATNTIPYTEIFKVVESKNIILIFINSLNYYPIAKNNLEGGTSRELMDKLRSIPGIRVRKI